MNALHRQRLNRLNQALKEKDLTQMIICDPLSIWYLTGVSVDPGERLFVLCVRTDGTAFLPLRTRISPWCGLQTLMMELEFWPNR